MQKAIRYMQFQSVLPQMNTSQIPHCMNKRLSDKPDLELSNNRVNTLLKNVQVGKLSGPDKLPYRVLTEPTV